MQQQNNIAAQLKEKLSSINNETQKKDNLPMLVGYLIANTNLRLDEIAEALSLKSVDYLYDVLFKRHKSSRDSDKVYQSRYFILCEKMNIKNRL